MVMEILIITEILTMDLLIVGALAAASGFATVTVTKHKREWPRKHRGLFGSLNLRKAGVKEIADLVLSKIFRLEWHGP